MAETFYLKALENLQIPVESPTAKNMKTPVSLAMGLANMSDKSIKKQAIPLFQRIIGKFISEKAEEWMIRQVIHKLTETLAGLDMCQEALNIMETIPPEVLLDALLWQKKGDILEHLRRFREAKDCFKHSIEHARSTDLEDPQTLLNCLQHYANFLVNNRYLIKQYGEDPESYLKQAKKLFEKSIYIVDKRVLLILIRGMVMRNF